MTDRAEPVDILIVGGGPAGIAAAVTARRLGKRVALMDMLPWPGGQIWRGGQAKNGLARRWLTALGASGASQYLGTTAFDFPAPGVVLAEKNDHAIELRYDKLILALGARELFIPFPGWTLPGVYGTGALQALVKNGWPVAGKRIAVAGSGPLLFAVAAELRRAGARVVLIAEQAGLGNLIGFGACLPFLSPGKLLQGASYQASLLGVPYRTGCYPVQARGSEALEQVRFRRGHKSWSVQCDMLACGFGLIPSLEIPRLLDCRIEAGLVAVDENQQTSVADVYAAGELTGVGGVDKALVEGQIAALAAAGQPQDAWYLTGRRKRYRAFATWLARSFALTKRVKQIPTENTIVCRCEDIRLSDLAGFADWRSAKLQTRCGMGSCQGRTCGGIMHTLRGWEDQSIRPPLFPVALEALCCNSSPDHCQS